MTMYDVIGSPEEPSGTYVIEYGQQESYVIKCSEIQKYYLVLTILKTKIRIYKFLLPKISDIIFFMFSSSEKSITNVSARLCPQPLPPRLGYVGNKVAGAPSSPETKRLR